jgi:hypothetical protein
MPRKQHERPRSPSSQLHAFSHAPAALRVFRFAADSAPRVLELAHVSAFLRECAVEFGSADAAMPAAMRSWYASGWYFEPRNAVERRAWRCRWLAAKLLACRCGAPMPAAALAPDVTRHDVNWGAEGARRHASLELTHDGFGLMRNDDTDGFSWTQGPVGVATGKHFFWRWAQGPVGVTSGKHYFQVCVTAPGRGKDACWDGRVSAVPTQHVGLGR